jgi:hypothetical protein
MSEQEHPTPGWGHLGGHLAMRPPAPHPQRDEAVDRFLIGERISRYGWAFDERRADLIADNFTADAVWEGTIRGEDPLGPIEGREAVVGWLSEYWPRQHDQRRHAIVNTVIERLDADEAVAQAYQLLTAARLGQVAVETTGFYRFELRREGDAWRIARLFSGYDAPFVPGKLDHLGDG